MLANTQGDTLPIVSLERLFELMLDTLNRVWGVWGCGGAGVRGIRRRIDVSHYSCATGLLQGCWRNPVNLYRLTGQMSDLQA